MQPIWFTVGFTYLLLGVAQLCWATSLQSVEEPEVPLSLEQEEQLSEADKVNARAEAEAELEKTTGVIGYEDITFLSIRRFAKGFNKSTKTNRWILCVAALSFFLAAGVAFWQGTGVISP